MSPPAPSLPDAIHQLKSLMEREKAAGVTHVSVSGESLAQLRALPEQWRKERQMGSRPAPAPAAAQTTPKLAESPAAPSTPVSPPPAASTPTGDEASRIAALAKEAQIDEGCRSLGTLRDTMVFSVGSPQADLMFVGEAPGFEEERQGEPFVGPAGKKLTQIIQAMGLRRPDDVYISNIVKFRPLDGDARFQGQRNRKPSPVEMGASVKYIKSEIEIVKPKVIVALGATAAEGLLEINGSISRLRNQFHDLSGIPVMVTYHPSYLLRQESKTPDGGKADKRKVWEDMLMVMERLGLAISEKQRGFFQ